MAVGFASRGPLAGDSYLASRAISNVTPLDQLVRNRESCGSANSRVSPRIGSSARTSLRTAASRRPRAPRFASGQPSRSGERRWSDTVDAHRSAGQCDRGAGGELRSAGRPAPAGICSAFSTSSRTQVGPTVAASWTLTFARRAPPSSAPDVARRARSHRHLRRGRLKRFAEMRSGSNSFATTRNGSVESTANRRRFGRQSFAAGWPSSASIRCSSCVPIRTRCSARSASASGCAARALNGWLLSTSGQPGRPCDARLSKRVALWAGETSSRVLAGRRTRRAWEMTHALTRRGVSTPRILLYLQTRSVSQIREILVTERSGRSVSLTTFLAHHFPGLSPRQKEIWIRTSARLLAGELARMREFSLIHRELSAVGHFGRR